MRSDSNGLPCTMGGLVENGREGCGRESGEGGWKEISRSAKAPAPSLPEGGQFVQTNQENYPGDTFSVPHTSCMQVVEPSSCLVMRWWSVCGGGVGCVVVRWGCCKVAGGEGG